MKLTLFIWFLPSDNRGGHQDAHCQQWRHWQSHFLIVAGCLGEVGFGKARRVKKFHKFHDPREGNGQDVLSIKGIEEPESVESVES